MKFLRSAIADAMHEEYTAIVDAGFVLQIDDPDLADAWQIYPKMSVPEYRKFAELRLDAPNHALRDVPADRVRFHMCWGSYHGPHRYDILLRDIVDLILKVRADAYSIEASNPCHEHEWPNTIKYGVTFRALVLVLDWANPALAVCLLPTPMAVAYPSLGIVRSFMRSLCRGYVPQRCGLRAARRQARRAVPRDRRAPRGLPRDGQASR